MKPQPSSTKWALALGMGWALAIMAPSTVQSAGVIGQLGLLDTSGNNPATGQPWEVGDEYRLAFITSTNFTDSNNTYPSSSDISTYNASVQSVANSSPLGLGSVQWNVIGSTSDVAARDNTSTNPLIDGSGHSIIAVDGSTVIADDFNELWSGTVQNPINLTEDGTAFTGIPWPYTGTKQNGTSRTGGSDFSPLGGGGNIGQGTLTNNSNWVWRVWTGSTNDSLPYYALSETLTTMPEPTSGLLIGLGGLLALLRRRR